MKPSVDIDRVAEMREGGATYREIADELGSTDKVIERTCLFNGIEKPNADYRSKSWDVPKGPLVTKDGRRRFLPDEDARILELAAQRLGHRAIGARVGRTYSSIQGRLAILARREERKASQV